MIPSPLPALTPGTDIDLHNLPALRLPHLDPATTRKLYERVVAERKWMIVVVDAPGPDEKECTDLLHEFHAQMWNAPLGTIARYVDQSAHAEVRVEEQTDDRIVLTYIDKRSDPVADPVPLSLQLLLPENWTRFSVEQKGQEPWAAVVHGRATWNALPGSMTLSWDDANK